MLTLPRFRFTSRPSTPVRVGLAGSIALTGIAVALTLAGCGVESTATPAATAITPTYHPSPPTSASVSDADVEAAIAALNNYIDRANDLAWTDPGSFEDFYALTTGNQNASDREFYGGMLDHGWHVEGASTVTVLDSLPRATDADVLLNICVNTTDTHVIDQTGAERRPTGALPVQAMTAALTRGDLGQWLLSDLSSREGEPTC